jgi:nucleoside-diphosphate-sugar epimerase
MMTETELEELLSTPTEADHAAMSALGGDLLILGAGGKMGPSLARRARRAGAKRVVAVARFTDRKLAGALESEGIETMSCDLLDTGSLARLPDAPNVIFMAARKFGTTGAEYMTWALNAYLPGLVAERYRESRIVAFSTGNVYPLVPVAEGGATETTTPAPQGEYAQSALGRERMFEYGAQKWGTKVTLLRLNYAIDLRYGVLLDIGLEVFAGRPIDLHMGFVNIIWQGDANSICLRAFAHCDAPPLVVNVTGPETLAVASIAREFGKRFGREPSFAGEPSDVALISNANKARRIFGDAIISAAEMIDWTAEWIASGGPTLQKPTHFQVSDGRF